MNSKKNTTTNMFAELDSFLTGLILDRAPAEARANISAWVGAPAHKKSVRRMKSKSALVAA